MEENKKKFPVRVFVECALMIAVATVLSLIKIDLPTGGGVTICSMLPIILISHRHGCGWGIGRASAYSLVQLLLGLDNVGYATNFLMGAGIVLLDYVLAYTVLGLSGAFDRVFEGRKKATAIGIAFVHRYEMTRKQNLRTALFVGIFVTFTLRFICHLLTGAWIWGEWMPDEFLGRTMTSPWTYSALYNGWYMLVELIITELAAMLLYGPLGRYFRGDDRKKNDNPEN